MLLLSIPATDDPWWIARQIHLRTKEEGRASVGWACCSMQAARTSTDCYQLCVLFCSCCPSVMVFCCKCSFFCCKCNFCMCAMCAVLFVLSSCKGFFLSMQFFPQERVFYALIGFFPRGCMWHPLNFVGGAVLLCVVCPLLTLLCVLCGAKIMRAQLFCVVQKSCVINRPHTYLMNLWKWSRVGKGVAWYNWDGTDGGA